jgi:hypothetical protein
MQRYDVGRLEQVVEVVAFDPKVWALAPIGVDDASAQALQRPNETRGDSARAHEPHRPAAQLP